MDKYFIRSAIESIAEVGAQGDAECLRHIEQALSALERALARLDELAEADREEAQERERVEDPGAFVDDSLYDSWRDSRSVR